MATVSRWGRKWGLLVSRYGGWRVPIVVFSDNHQMNTSAPSPCALTDDDDWKTFMTDRLYRMLKILFLKIEQGMLFSFSFCFTLTFMDSIYFYTVTRWTFSLPHWLTDYDEYWMFKILSYWKLNREWNRLFVLFIVTFTTAFKIPFLTWVMQWVVFNVVLYGVVFSGCVELCCVVFFVVLSCIELSWGWAYTWTGFV